MGDDKNIGKLWTREWIVGQHPNDWLTREGFKGVGTGLRTRMLDDFKREPFARCER